MFLLLLLFANLCSEASFQVDSGIPDTSVGYTIAKKAGLSRISIISWNVITSTPVELCKIQTLAIKGRVRSRVPLRARIRRYILFFKKYPSLGIYHLHSRAGYKKLRELEETILWVDFSIVPEMSLH